MNIENFLLRYPATPELKEILANERLPERSLVATLALNFAKEAGYELREATRSLSDSNFAFELDSASFLRLPMETQEKIRVSHAGVVFGVSIPPLEQSCITGFYDLGEWFSLYNMEISGTPFSQMKAEEAKNREGLSIGNLQNIRGVVRKDPTFASFFAEDVRFAPEGLKRILVNSGILPIIKQHILPPYNERVKFLVA